MTEENNDTDGRRMAAIMAFGKPAPPSRAWVTIDLDIRGDIRESIFYHGYIGAEHIARFMRAIRDGIGTPPVEEPHEEEELMIRVKLDEGV